MIFSANNLHLTRSAVCAAQVVLICVDLRVENFEDRLQMDDEAWVQQ